MKSVARKGLLTAVVATGVLASAGLAQADSAAGGGTAGSPGVLSGNTVQAPVEIPVNACGNTINVIGLLNPAMGNSCANASAGSARSHASASPIGAHPAGHAGPAVDSGGPREEISHPAGRAPTGGSGAAVLAAGRGATSPGPLAGTALRPPIRIPAHLSGNTVNVVGAGDPAFGSTSVNRERPEPPLGTVPDDPAPPPHQPIPAPPNVPVTEAPALAHTGSAGIGWATAASAGLLLGGVLLYRRFRPGRG